MLNKNLIAVTHGAANAGNIIRGAGYRVCVLTDGIFRIETGGEIDEASQAFWNRDLGKVEFTHEETNGVLRITTERAVLQFDVKKLRVKSVYLQKEKRAANLKKGNLGGTIRTLDNKFGAVSLGEGLNSAGGAAVYDDTKSLLLTADGHFKKRETGRGYGDLYLFAYGNDYRACIQDFFKISAPTPLVPRYALGVWWSRYHRYTQKEYQDLMLRFEEENLPLTVATVDMDWHYTDLNADFGAHYPSKIWSDNPCTGGWTGYSWDKKLFPDHKAFLAFLHEHDLKVTLNLHPADGVRWHEDAYSAMCEKMGIDPASKRPVEFDLTDDRFTNAYFDVLHRSLEKEGVDFWWIDWQQGTRSAMDGLDPLWALNHYHFLDKGLVLSRYAGLGSHRYPLGFSGDAAISWKMLDFQPYMTSAAANVGYNWWSHDIGGHHLGVKDDDLYLRWLQFGVFAPVMRLHTTSHDLMCKEPWTFVETTANTAKKYLRLRHRLIPYLYTLDYRAHAEGLPLCEPLYFRHPGEKDAYEVKNEYYFGENVIISPITSPTSSKIKMGCCDTWLPKGKWTDAMTGHIYDVTEEHGRRFTAWRDVAKIPIFVKAGGIIPLSNELKNGADNPKSLTILVYSGNGDFEMFEDGAKTSFAVKEENDKIIFTLDTEVEREYIIKFVDLKEERIMTSGGQIVLEQYSKTVNPTAKEAIIDIMSKWQESTVKKRFAYNAFKHADGDKQLKNRLAAARLPKEVKSAIYELL